MRAICGAIISAGALIGLGLAAVGLGIRYQTYPYLNQAGEPQWVLFRNMDTALMIAIVAALVALGIGLGIAFIGLAYHHHRRHHEHLREELRYKNGRPVERSV
jgi:hypothetical protein